MEISKKLDNIPAHHVSVSHRYENILLFLSVMAFLSMATVFFLVLSL